MIPATIDWRSLYRQIRAAFDRLGDGVWDVRPDVLYHITPSHYRRNETCPLNTYCVFRTVGSEPFLAVSVNFFGRRDAGRLEATASLDWDGLPRETQELDYLEPQHVDCSGGAETLHRELGRAVNEILLFIDRQKDVILRELRHGPPVAS